MVRGWVKVSAPHQKTKPRRQRITPRKRPAKRPSTLVSSLGRSSVSKDIASQWRTAVAGVCEQQCQERMRASATGALTTARNDSGGKRRLQCGTDARLHERQELFDEQRRSGAYIREPLPKGDGNDAP
jgi:hypothetical protein